MDSARILELLLGYIHGYISSHPLSQLQLIIFFRLLVVFHTCLKFVLAVRSWINNLRTIGRFQIMILGVLTKEFNIFHT